MKKNKQKTIFYWSVLALPLVQVFLFYICVNFNSILLAFKVYESENVFHWDFVANFARVFSELDGYILSNSIGNSIQLFFIMFLFSNLLSLISSYYFYRKAVLAGTFRKILFMPQIISSVVLVLIFKIVVDEAYPVVVEMFTGEKVLGLLANAETRWGTILVYSVLISYGTNTLLYSGAMSNINQAVIEAARIDGAGFIREFVSVVVPGVWPTFVTLTAVGIAGIFTNQANLYTIYGGSIPDYSISTVGYYLFREARADMITMTEYPYLAALGLFFTAIIVPFPILIRKLLTKFGPSEE